MTLRRGALPTVVEDLHVAALHPVLCSELILEFDQPRFKRHQAGESFRGTRTVGEVKYQHVFLRVVVECCLQPRDFLFAFEEPDHAAQVYASEAPSETSYGYVI